MRMASPSDASQSKLSRTQILKRSLVRELNFEAFQECLNKRTRNPKLALKSEGSIRRVLEELAKRFWLRGTILDEGLADDWNERRNAAEWLLSISDDVIRAAERLTGQEARLWLHFSICGTGRHTRADICAPGIGEKLHQFIEGLRELKPLLTEVMEKRKPRIDDDENLFLYLMATFLNKQHSGHISAAAIHQEISTLVNAWGDSLVGTAVDTYELHERDIERRIARFRENNQKAAAYMDSNPFRYIQHFLGAFPQIKYGLRPDDEPLENPTFPTRQKPRNQ